MRLDQSFRLAVMASGLMLADLMHARAPVTPLGRWNTISDEDGKATAVVEIRESGDLYFGVVRALLIPAEPKDSVCGKCSGERQGQRVVGMEILRRMRHVDDDGKREWSGGEILDPESGKTYKASMTLSEDGQTLTVRGYIGFSMFGRSQKWKRAD
jgi:uncharacterized protein (DUF2147 family)